MRLKIHNVIPAKSGIQRGKSPDGIPVSAGMTSCMHRFMLCFLSTIFSFSACKPAVEKVYESSFNLRAARELDSMGDVNGARYYLGRAQAEINARTEADDFLRRIAARKTKAGVCIDDKKTDLEINQYPRIRHKHYFQLGVCLESAGETDKALKSYKLSESAGSRQPQLYIRRGLLLEKTGDVAAAATDFARAVDLNPEYPPAQLSQALFFVRNGRGVDAGKIAAAIQTKKPAYAAIILDLSHDSETFAKVWRQSNSGVTK